MMKMKILLAASILCAMMTTCAGAAGMTDNMGNMAGFPPISSINIPKDDNIVSAVWNGIVQEDAKSFFQKSEVSKEYRFYSSWKGWEIRTAYRDGRRKQRARFCHELRICSCSR